MHTDPSMLSAILVLVFSAPAISETGNKEAQLTRGEYLVNGIVACGHCHTPRNADATSNAELRLAGGFLIEESEFRVYAPNITQVLETGIGGWSDEDIMRAIREGVRPPGLLRAANIKRQLDSVEKDDFPDRIPPPRRGPGRKLVVRCIKISRIATSSAPRRAVGVCRYATHDKPGATRIPVTLRFRNDPRISGFRCHETSLKRNFE